MHDPA
jgi:hypothetical protein